jgi:outer membrane autotransporter protein
MNHLPSPLARCIAIALGSGLCLFAPLSVADTVAVTTATTSSQVLTGERTLEVSSSGSITTSAKAVELKNATSGAGVIVDNSGLIKSTGDRGIDSSGSNTDRIYQIINREGATIEASKQGIRVSNDLSGTTVSIDNAGTIVSQTDRAIMLKDLQTDVSISILNRATGLIQGKDDAMRVGSNATITNYGTLTASDMINADAKYDGIDFDVSTGGTVYNHGLISGGRHGITTDKGATLVNYEDGVIIGRNGSGFGSDGDGSVTNYGRITGAFSGLGLDDGDDDGIDDPVPTGDGDGVDIDGQGTIDNYGIIEGIGAGGFKDGAANTSEGIAMGGGSIVNHSGATISGAANGILIDDSAAGGAPYATLLENYGSIYGLDGDAVRIIGTQADSVINGGLISSIGGVALDLGGGDDSLTLRAGSQFVGLVDGGAGSDTLTLNDAAGGSFGDSQNFEWLDVRSGIWTLTSDDFSEGGEVASGAELVNGGNIGGTLTVLAGGTYSGGGQLADLTLDTGSTLGFAVAADGSHNPVQVSGTAQIDGAILDIRAGSGTYPNVSEYRVIDAGSVEGEFASVHSNFAFLTPTLSYSDTRVDLQLTRNDVAFADLANSGNGASAGGSIAPDNAVLYNALVLSDADTAGKALEQLAGSSNASLTGATLAGSSQVGGAMQGAMQQLGGMGGSLQASILRDGNPQLAALDTPPEARGLNDPNAAGRLWLQGLGSHGRVDGENGASAVKQDTGGALLGADWALDRSWRLGVVGGYSSTDVDAGNGASGDIDSLHVGVYALHQQGPLALRLGAAYSRHDGESKRHVAFGDFSDTPRGDYDADSQQAFAELGYQIARGRLLAEPFAGLGYQRYNRDAYDEKGGAAALHVDSQEQDNLSSSLGVRIARLDQFANGMSFTPRLSVGWRHTFGDVDSSARQNFLAGGDAFSVQGTALDRDSLLLDVGAEVGISATQNLSLGYSGEMGTDSQNHALIAQWQLAF